MELTKREKRKLRLEKLGRQSVENQPDNEENVEPQFHSQQASSRKPMLLFIAGAVGVIILAAIVYSIYSFNQPGQYDNFAKCLSEKGAVMYGALDWCKFTQAQKAMFGKSFKYLNYHEYTELPGIKKTPTWIINGAWQENVQSFDKLASLTGCKL